MKKVLVIDNYDSFVYNLVHYLEEFDCEVVVKRNDEIDLDEIAEFEKIVLSPGPGIPDEAGLLKPIIEKYASTKPILGVCLGLQAIVEVFDGELTNLKTVHHGVSTEIDILCKDEILFKDLPRKIQVGRYHSWVAKPELPEILEATSIDKNGQVMSLRHKTFDLRAMQFHPESVLTPEGKTMIENWVMPKV